MSRRHGLIGASKPWLYKEEDAEFYYRRTSGGVIMNNSPLVGSIDRIKGQTIAWNQLCEITDVNTKVLVKDETDTTLDTYKVIANPPAASSRCLRLKEGDNISSNHKVLLILIFKSNFTNPLRFTYLDGNNNSISSSYDYYRRNEWNICSHISDGITFSASSGLRVNSSYIEGEYISLPKNGGFQVYDLTLIYGEGNEPSTPEEFEADYLKWFGKPLTYEPYDAGSLRNVQMEGIKTTFTNASPQTRNFDVTSITGKLNGEGESVVIFPDGMKGVNDVKDEIYIEDGVTKAVKRVGRVDLGSLDWRYVNGYTSQNIKYFSSGSITDAKTILSTSIVANIVNAIYQTTAGVNIYYGRGDKLIASYTNLVRVLDSSYTDATTFKTAMSGVYLDYELAEPQIYVLDTPLPIAYNCEAGGTEQILPEEIGTGIAPIMDIKYNIGQINN